MVPIILLVIGCFYSTYLLAWRYTQSYTNLLNNSTAVSATHLPRVLLVSDSLVVIDGNHILERLTTNSWTNGKDSDGNPLHLEPHSHKLHDDAWYERHRLVLQDEDTECPFIADFQTQPPNPTCNTVHEVGFRVTPMENPVLFRLKFLNEGAFKQVWQPYLEDGNRTDFVLKTTFFNDYTQDDLLGDQQDAIVMERNTASPYVLNMFAYCHYSNLVQRADGTLVSWMRHHKDATPLELLRVTNMLVQGVKDVHMFVDSKRYYQLPTIAHADIKPSQFLETSPGHFRLNDFNRANFLTSKNRQTICPFYMPGVRHKGSRMRAPEEYEDNGPQDDKIDVFALGSTIYQLLYGKPPFADLEFEDAMKSIRDGVEPEMPDVTDRVVVTIKKIIKMCRRFDPKNRPWSWEIAEYVEKRLRSLEKKAAQAANQTI
eukprot:scaffold24226_cov186-Cylindrotheca_fusiformis.AAC.1